MNSITFIFDDVLLFETNRLGFFRKCNSRWSALSFFPKKEKKDSRHHRGYLRNAVAFLETSGPRLSTNVVVHHTN